MTTMHLAALGAAIPESVFDRSQHETHFNFRQEETPGLKKPNRHRKWFDSATQRRGRRGSSFSRTRR